MSTTPSVCAEGNPLVFQGKHHCGVGHPSNVSYRRSEALQAKCFPAVVCGEQAQITANPKASKIGRVRAKDVQALLVFHREAQRQRRPCCPAVPRFQNADAVVSPPLLSPVASQTWSRSLGSIQASLAPRGPARQCQTRTMTVPHPSFATSRLKERTPTNGQAVQEMG